MIQQAIVRKTIAPRRVVRRARPRGPVLKWVGGKSKLLSELVARAPRSYLRYFEPFVGGGALFFGLQPQAAILSDANAELIGCYRAIQTDVEAVIRALLHHQDGHGEAHFYATRERWNQRSQGAGSPERAATFIYLNKTCYNGLWRVNSQGAFNVPMGRYTNPAILNPEALRCAAAVLRGARLQVGGFDSVTGEARAGDFVYFDPPYDPVSETAYFTSYTRDSFQKADQERLALAFRSLADRGCAVMLSNSDTPFVRKLYAGFRIDRVSCIRAINSRANLRGAVPEVIVTNSF